MIIEILASIIGFFALVSVEHFFVAVGFFSIWALLVIYLYEKVKSPVIWIFLIFAGAAIGTTIGTGMGTYIVSAGFSLIFLFLIKKFIPDDTFLGKYIQYLVSFFIFYIFRLIFADLSKNITFPSIQFEDIQGFILKSFISVLIIILIDRIYSQLRHNGGSLSKGVGIEVRRR